MRRRNSRGASDTAGTASPAVGGNTCNRREESVVQSCLPNWMQIVWSWRRWPHDSWFSASIAIAESARSRSSDGMMAPTATIHTAKTVIRRSPLRPVILIRLIIPSTLGRDQEGVNGAIPQSRLAILWHGTHAGRDQGIPDQGRGPQPDPSPAYWARASFSRSMPARPMLGRWGGWRWRRGGHG